MPTFVRLAAAADLPDNSMRAYQVGERRIALYHCAGTFYATDDICSHDYAELTHGYLDPDDCTVECPLHGSRFQLATGAVLSLPAYQPIATYPVQLIDGELLVGL